MTVNKSCANGLSSLVVDACDPGLRERIVSVSKEPVWRLASLEMLNRPAPRFRIQTVALQYWVYGVGGGEKVTRALIELFRSRGYRVLLYTDRPATGTDLDLPSDVVRKIAPKTSDEDRVDFWLSEVTSEQIDLVVYGAWLSGWAPVDLLAIQAAGATVVYHMHGSILGIMGNEKQDWLFGLYERCAQFADLIVALSDDDCMFASVYNACSYAVVNPVVTSVCDESPVFNPPQGKDIMFCGRLVPGEKGLDSLLEAFAVAHRLDPELRLKLVGPASDAVRAGINDAVIANGTSDAVELVGCVDDPLPLMRASRTLVMASPSEGFPLVLAEAASVGLPAVMFQLPYLTLVKGNEGVVQVPQGDVEGLGRALARVCGDEDVQRRMRRAMRAAYDRVCSVDLNTLWSDLFRQAREAHRTPAIKAPHAQEGRAVWDRTVIDACHRALKRTCDVQAELACAWHANEDLRRQNEETSQRICALERSYTWKVGRLITALPRALVRLARRFFRV